MTRQKGIPGLVALKQIIESTSSYTGIEFFRALVHNLAEILDVHGVWITEFWPNENKLNASVSTGGTRVGSGETKMHFMLDGSFMLQFGELTSSKQLKGEMGDDFSGNIYNKENE